MSREKVIEAARAELGYTEDPPGSNRTKYGAAYGLNAAPWCVIFLWWCFREAGERMAFFGGEKTASCSALLRWYKDQGMKADVSDIHVGDIVLLNFTGKGTPDHCGLVADVVDCEDATCCNTRQTICYTIEGNTTPGEEGSQDNGGCVALKRRFKKNIVAVCRPQYPPEPEAGDDISGHWAEESVRWCMEHGLMKGYPDGSFRPDRGVTRAELAAALKRMEESK